MVKSGCGAERAALPLSSANKASDTSLTASAWIHSEEETTDPKILFDTLKAR